MLNLLASLVVTALLVLSLAFYIQNKSAPQPSSAQSEETGPSSSYPALNVTGLGASQSSSYTTLRATNGKGGVLNCTGPAEAFVDEGALYSQFGYPLLSGYTTANYIDPLRPSFIYFVQFPNEYDVALGNLEIPMSTVCQGIGYAATALGISPSNYTLAEVSLNDAELNTAYPSTTVSWDFYFARVYDGYWIYGTVGSSYSAVARVNAVTNNVYDVSMDNYSLSGSPPVHSPTVNSSQAPRDCPTHDDEPRALRCGERLGDLHGSQVRDILQRAGRSLPGHSFRERHHSGGRLEVAVDSRHERAKLRGLLRRRRGVRPGPSRPWPNRPCLAEAALAQQRPSRRRA